MLYLVVRALIVFPRVFSGERVTKFSHAIMMKRIIHFIIFRLACNYNLRYGDLVCETLQVK